jgi:hypothetical protein
MKLRSLSWNFLVCITAEARVLLKEASKDAHGTIIYARYKQMGKIWRRLGSGVRWQSGKWL